MSQKSGLNKNASFLLSWDKIVRFPPTTTTPGVIWGKSACTGKSFAHKTRQRATVLFQKTPSKPHPALDLPGCSLARDAGRDGARLPLFLVPASPE